MENWKERFDNLFLVRFWKENSIKANNKKEQPVADILEKVKNSHIQELEDFISQELDKAREEGFEDGKVFEVLRTAEFFEEDYQDPKLLKKLMNKYKLKTKEDEK